MRHGLRIALLVYVALWCLLCLVAGAGARAQAPADLDEGRGPQPVRVTILPAPADRDMVDVPDAAPRVVCLARPDREWVARPVTEEGTGGAGWLWASKREAWANRRDRWVVTSQDGWGRVAAKEFCPADTSRMLLSYVLIEAPEVVRGGVYAPVPGGIEDGLAIEWALLRNGAVVYTCPWGSAAPHGGVPAIPAVVIGDAFVIRVRLEGDIYLFSASTVVVADHLGTV